MNIHDVRRAKLMLLAKEVGTLSSLARRVNPKSKYLDRYLSQITTGRRNLGGRLARKLEVATAKPTGWMDIPTDSERETVELLTLWAKLPRGEQVRFLQDLRVRIVLSSDVVDAASIEERLAQVTGIPPKIKRK